jgi:hypothetical protein
MWRQSPKIVIRIAHAARRPIATASRYAPLITARHIFLPYTAPECNAFQPVMIRYQTAAAVGD